jgi:hypothetical protein
MGSDAALKCRCSASKQRPRRGAVVFVIERSSVQIRPVVPVLPLGRSLFSSHLSERRLAWHFCGTFRDVELGRHGRQPILPALQIPLHHPQIRVTDEVHGKFGIARLRKDLARDHTAEPMRRAQRQVRDTGLVSAPQRRAFRNAVLKAANVSGLT